MRLMETQKFRDTGYSSEKIKELSKWKHNSLVRDGFLVEVG